MEFFPDGIFARDVEVVANALGIQYAAWWGDQFVFPFELIGTMGYRRNDFDLQEIQRPVSPTCSASVRPINR